MIDFTECKEVLNHYRGSEKKKTLIYNDHRYLVKFPDPIREKNKDISYINNAFSEYVGSNIFSIIGLNSQHTVLGTYLYKETKKVVCACEDFTSDNITLCEFERLVLSTNLDKKIGTELEDLMSIIEECDMIDTLSTKNNFWNMFVIDALIGNTDRHNGNWGFLFNNETQEVTFAPIYDCGSCLNPMLTDEEMDLMSDTELKNLAINCYSCFKENDKKIHYMTYLKSKRNEECNRAIQRIVPKIDIEAIYRFIDGIELMSAVRKSFYKKIIEIRLSILKSLI